MYRIISRSNKYVLINYQETDLRITEIIEGKMTLGLTCLVQNKARCYQVFLVTMTANHGNHAMF